MSGHQVVRRSRRPRLVLVLLALAPMVLSGCYSVALFGDVPYSSSNEAKYQRLLSDVNDQGVAFSAHVGDFQASTSTCTDQNVLRNVGWFDSLNNPLIYTPGDNDWTDCRDGLTRLARLRALVYRGDGARSRGRTTMALNSQATLGYPENAMWTDGPITYVTLHVVGSSDGSGSERTARRQADIAWLQRAFSEARARGDRGIVVLAHTTLRFERAEGAKGSYEALFQALRNETTGFAGQVLYVHGDLHHFLDDRPMRTSAGAPVPNFRRVEVYGDPDVRWVKLTVDPGATDPFSITAQPAP